MVAPRIAVVDHSSVFVRLMGLILETAGYEMIACPSGATAHEEIAREQPDLVIIDTWLKV